MLAEKDELTENNSALDLNPGNCNSEKNNEQESLATADTPAEPDSSAKPKQKRAGRQNKRKREKRAERAEKEMKVRLGYRSPSPGSRLRATPATKARGHEFYSNVLKKPKHIVAPMVDHSFLAYRMLCRRHGADLCYTPMFHANNFSKSASYRNMVFSTCPQDRPLAVQFCGNQPDILLKAAKFVEKHCDAVDINFGCPQRIAKTGNYGAFLAEGDWNLIYSLVRNLHDNLSVPVICKMRIFPTLERTLNFARLLEAAGAQMVVVHGRTKEQKGQNVGLADWTAIKAVKDTLTVPVVANGNIMHFSDVDKCIQATGCDGVMSAEAILKNPGFFDGKEHNPFDLAQEYLELCRLYPTEPKIVKAHFQKILRAPLDRYVDAQLPLAKLGSLDALEVWTKELRARFERNDPAVTEIPTGRGGPVDETVLTDALLALNIALAQDLDEDNANKDLPL